MALNNYWSNEKTLRFINEVSLHPELWDVEHAEYRLRDKKHDSWAEIALKYDIATDEAQKKFKSLRTYAKSEERKLERNKSSCLGGKTDSTWFAYSAMSFILSRDITFVESRNDAIQISPETSGQGSPRNIIFTQIKNESNMGTEEEMDLMAQSKKRKSKFRETGKTLKKARHLVHGSSTSKRSEYAGFGEHVAQRLSSYDSEIRAEVQFQISKILYEADMKMLRSTTSHSDYSNDNTE